MYECLPFSGLDTFPSDRERSITPFKIPDLPDSSQEVSLMGGLGSLAAHRKIDEIRKIG